MKLIIIELNLNTRLTPKTRKKNFFSIYHIKWGKIQGKY